MEAAVMKQVHQGGALAGGQAVAVALGRGVGDGRLVSLVVVGDVGGGGDFRRRLVVDALFLFLVRRAPVAGIGRLS